MGFLKDDSLYSTPEFLALDEATQHHLKKPSMPSWEFCTGLPVLSPPRPGPPKRYLNSIGVLMNPQSRGTVKLGSADPRTPALFDPQLMLHPYDRRVLITAARNILAFLQTSIAKTIEAPINMLLDERGEASDAEEDIVAFLKENVRSTWHMSGSCKMGTPDDDMAVVDSQFRVRGVEGLRVVDLSVLPFLINAHPVVAAYAVGEIAAEKIWKGGKEVDITSL